MSRVVTFGEIMLRLNPEGYRRFPQADRFEASYAGSEANVAVSLSILGDDAAFVSKVPQHDIGQNAVNELRRYGVDTSCMLRGGPRLGVYYVEKGASQRGSKVIYDRAGSSIALAGADEFDWEAIFRGADWYHTSGITPALGGEMPRATLDSVVAAKKMGLAVSCDLNYRAKLWTKEQAGSVMQGIVPYVDMLIANEEQARDLFGIRAESEGREQITSVARQLAERFGLSHVVMTLRSGPSASDNDWAAMLLSGGKAFFSRTYRIHLVDRVGGGDSLAAGLIHALRKGFGAQEALDFAVAASCLKQTNEFDYCLATEDEVLALMNGDGSGRVQR